MDASEQKDYFEDVYKKYGREVYAYVSAHILQGENAEDVVAHIFVRLWGKVAKNVRIDNVRALLYTIARGLIIDHYRKNKRKSVRIENVAEVSIATEDQTESDMIRNEERAMLYDKLDNIPSQYKDCLVMYYIQELKIAEIAQIMKKNENTVRVTIHRALQSLKKTYE